MTMKEQIQQLIANGRTEEALAILTRQAFDLKGLRAFEAVRLLQTRYNNDKKQYNMGLIEFSEWKRTQAQINYAVLEEAGHLKETKDEPTAYLSFIGHFKGIPKDLENIIQECCTFETREVIRGYDNNDEKVFDYPETGFLEGKSYKNVHSSGYFDVWIRRVISAKVAHVVVTWSWSSSTNNSPESAWVALGSDNNPIKVGDTGNPVEDWEIDWSEPAPQPPAKGRR